MSTSDVPWQCPIHHSARVGTGGQGQDTQWFGYACGCPIGTMSERDRVIAFLRSHAQYESSEAAKNVLLEKARQIAAGDHMVDSLGKPPTSSIGSALTNDLDELAEAAWMALHRTLYKHDVEPPLWEELSAKRRKAWRNAAMMVRNMVAPKENDEASK